MTESDGQVMLARRRQLSAWIAREIIPFEPSFRAFLLRNRLSAPDVDEVMQESYLRLFSLESFDHILNPRAYFFSIARNIVNRRAMASEVVSLEVVAGMETLCSEGQSPEQIVATRLDYERMMALIAKLPERCRKVVELRKIEGWSQRQIAEHLGIAEKTVEKQVWLGVKAIREAWARSEQKSGVELSMRRGWGRRGKSA